MNDLLRDTFHDRADGLDLPTIDLAAIETNGRRRRTRRRARLAGGALAVAAVVGLGGWAVPGLLGGGDQRATEQGFAASFAAGQPTWALRNIVHLDGRTFDVGRDIASMVQTDRGIVFSDRNAAVWSTDGSSESTRLGALAEGDPRLHASGSVAAWTELRDGSWTVTAFDQATGALQRTTVGKAQRPDDEFAEVRTSSVDNGTVYYTRGTTVWSWSPFGAATQPVRVPGTVEHGLQDARNGVFLSNGDGLGATVGPTPGTGVTVGDSGAQLLSPDAKYLLSEERADQFALYDTATGKVLDRRPPEYTFFIGYRWIDNDTYTAFGMREVLENPDGSSRDDGDFPLTLLECTVGSPCEVTVRNAGSLDDGIVLPFG